MEELRNKIKIEIIGISQGRDQLGKYHKNSTICPLDHLALSKTLNKYCHWCGIFLDKNWRKHENS